MILSNENFQIIITPNYSEFCKKGAEVIYELSKAAIHRKNHFTLALSGGVTPKGVYQAISEEPYLDSFIWKKIHLFWGDERWLPPENKENNYHMVSEALLKKIQIPKDNINPIRTEEIDPEDSAAYYEADICSFLSKDKKRTPQFDLTILGLGDDGHTASLFPNSESLTATEKLVVPTIKKDSAQKRITFTYPLINASKNILFLVSGKKKAGKVKAVLEGNHPNYEIPAAGIRPTDGKVIWILDSDAASLLSPSS